MTDRLCKKIARIAAACAAVLFLIGFSAAPLCANDAERAREILDNWTAIRWGDDNLAWVVHYPDELVEPWVSSESSKRRMTPEQTEAFRKSFEEELKIGSATAIMLSVHAFGARPLEIAPLAENVVLIDSAGKRVSPFVFEKKLDAPLRGLVQGFVFFPKQPDGDFQIAVKGLAGSEETIFSFPAGGIVRAGNIATNPPAEIKVPQTETAPQEVIVKIPTTKPTQPKQPESPKTPEVPDISTEAEVFEPTFPPQTPSEDETPPFIDTADLIPPLPTEQPTRPAQRLNMQQALDIYLRAWIAGDTDRMYELLSTESQGRISKELFAREITGGGFRQALKSGYKVSWSGDTAKVTAAKKMLFMRTLESKQIRFIEEEGSARVAW